MLPVTISEDFPSLIVPRVMKPTWGQDPPQVGVPAHQLKAVIVQSVLCRHCSSCTAEAFFMVTSMRATCCCGSVVVASGRWGCRGGKVHLQVSNQCVEVSGYCMQPAQSFGGPTCVRFSMTHSAMLDVIAVHR